MIKTILFDLGNVLEGPLNRAAFDAELHTLADHFGFEDGTAFWHHFYVCTEWEAVKRGRISRDNFWDNRFTALGVSDPVEQEHLWQRIFQYHGLFPPMRAAVSDLYEAGIRMSVLSNTDRTKLRNFLTSEYDIGHYFEHVISSAAAGFAKPDPEIYTHTLATLEVPAEAILFIDDQHRNTQPAEAVGMATIVFSSPQQALEAMQGHGLPVRSV